MKKIMMILAMAIVGMLALSGCGGSSVASSGDAYGTWGNGAYVSGGNAASYIMPLVSAGNAG